ncbi:hypothetical protein GR925_15235 [Streptomyces sp. HUCO-GS316]|uniref:hypothetical protein n=1 Tax=Streptomyces sp. HUCO-GS316 TaxID=2692198 RepID=UPI001370D3FF|nr:hypothetical protein [Streptomyces sp. HUCO-GS316]MXM64762.1 hypothetical protein [Streptomyces sp. HUCO-GS316]
MSTHPEPANRAYGTDAANNATGGYDVHGGYPSMAEPQGPPSVYQSRYAGTPAAYGAYGVPAVADGWQNAFDQTAELPPVTADGSPAHGPGPGVYEQHTVYVAAAGANEQYGAYGQYGAYEDTGPEENDGSVFVDGSGRRGRLIRRAAIAAGAVCVLFIAVVVAGLFDSGPAGNPLPWVQGKDDTKTGEPTPASSSADDSSSGAGGTPSDSSAGSGDSDEASVSPSSTPSGSSSGEGKTEEPTTAPSTTAAPTMTGPDRGNAGDNPGRGQGSTKGPK